MLRDVSSIHFGRDFRIFAVPVRHIENERGNGNLLLPLHQDAEYVVLHLHFLYLTRLQAVQKYVDLVAVGNKQEI